LKFHERKDSFLATNVSSSVRAVVKKITLVNLLNDDFDDVDDEVIAGRIVKRSRRHGKNGGSAEMEVKDETTFKHTKRPIVTLFDE